MDFSGVRASRAPLVIKRMGPARTALAAGIAITLLVIAFTAALVSFTQTRTATAIRAALSRPPRRGARRASARRLRCSPRGRPGCHTTEHADART